MTVNLQNMTAAQKAMFRAGMDAAGVVDQTARARIVNSLDSSYLPATTNLGQLSSAIKAGSAVIALVGHSIMEGQNQNWREASPARIFERMMREAFPDCVFTFINLSLGGRDAARFANTGYVGATNDNTPATGYFRPSSSNVNVWEVWRTPDLSINGSTVGKSWRQQVVDAAPDAVLFLHDLNEVSLSGFVTAMTTIMTNFQSGTEWNTKRPSVILGTSHVGLTTPALIRTVQRATRGLAAQYKVPYFDAGRFYDLLVTGKDVANYDITGEGGFRYNGGFSIGKPFVLDSAFWLMEGGNAAAPGTVTTVLSPSGASVRESVANNAFRAYRKKPAYDGRVRARFNPLSSAAVCELYARRDPAAPVGAYPNTSQYILRRTGTTLTLVVVSAATATYNSSAGTWSGGSEIVLQTVTGLTPLASGSSAILDFEVVGTRLRGWLDGKLLIDMRDYTLLDVGWFGVGAPAQGQSVQLSVGVSVQNGFSIEFMDPAQVVSTPPMKDTDLVGTVSDFATNPESVGGNSNNHMTTAGYSLIYPPAFRPVIQAIQAAVAR
jgi:hypothetical protein